MAFHRLLAVYILFLIFTQTLQNYIQRNRLGCFFAEDAFPHKHISFWLETSESLMNPIRLNPQKPTSEHFRHKFPVVIIVHGHNGNRLTTPNTVVGRAYLSQKRYHVISVDFGILAQEPCYFPWSMENAKVVGRNLARFIDNLIDYGCAERTNIEILAYDVGGPVVGHAAKLAKHRFHHVTALDVNGIGFPASNVELILDSSDIDFLVAIHTDFLMVGTQHSFGHVDFYVNPDSIVQPGCPRYDLNIIHLCSHQFAAIYFAETITGINRFWAKSCGSWLDMVQGKCDSYSENHIFVRMGDSRIKSIRGSFFLHTHSKPPYGKGFTY